MEASPQFFYKFYLLVCKMVVRLSKQKCSNSSGLNPCQCVPLLTTWKQTSLDASSSLLLCLDCSARGTQFHRPQTGSDTRQHIQCTLRITMCIETKGCIIIAVEMSSNRGDTVGQSCRRDGSEQRPTPTLIPATFFSFHIVLRSVCGVANPNAQWKFKPPKQRK